MTIRQAGEGDAEAVASLWNHYIRETLATFNSEEKSQADVAAIIARRAREGRAFLVAEGPDGLAGFATYFQFRGGVGYARTMEHTVLLDPGAKGRGIGRALMAAIEDHAREAGHGSIFAGVSSGNPEGVAFHARLGYREVGRLPRVGWKWGQWWDLHLMQKWLRGREG